MRHERGLPLESLVRYGQYCQKYQSNWLESDGSLRNQPVTEGSLSLDSRNNKDRSLGQLDLDKCQKSLEKCFQYRKASDAGCDVQDGSRGVIVRVEVETLQ